ncbi:MAG TPA: hypothetical protein VJ805_09440 [Nitrospiraceae bacterium]|nr:hypothetical protein [Nitrospiraceae bacterium]
MAIPWTTALYLFRKVLPVVIDKAPELLKTLERRRRDAAPTGSPSADLPLTMLEQRIESLEQITAAQTELLSQLQAGFRQTRRSLTIVLTLLSATVLLGITIAVALFFRS